MKQGFIIIALVGWLIFPALGQHPSLDKNWQVIFEDNFSSFNGQRWYKSEGIHGIEPQHYIPANVSIENEKLVLTAKKENYHCTNPKCNCNGGTYSYTSSRVVSYNNSSLYSYGYYEMRAKLPIGKGLFPAFWLWSAGEDPDCWYNEIDIMEAGGCDPNVTTSNYREFCESEAPQKVAIPHPCNYADSFHWYGVEWDKNKITWYIDGIVVRQVKHTGMQHRMQIIINLALFPSWSDCQADGSPLFVHMYVDAVNAYKLKYECDTVVTQITNYDNPQTPNYYNYAVKKWISLNSTSSLQQGQNVSLRATDFIELKNDFYVPLGAELYLDINPCDNIGMIKKERE